ncbi:TPA: Gfo/Idh/MocA family oxidoreductase [Candidatus Poribacteria bacterium]|nr:Gfo/Idh/MocA family oxidoreductase [Candidatus Poribacteria bacterium]
MNKVYRVGIIGCGGISRAHAGGYLGVPNAKMVAVADINEENAKKFCQDYNVERYYTDYVKMLENESLDIVSICTWPPLHCEMTVRSAEYGVKGILCEKPMALNLKECDMMISACDKSKSVLVIGHQRRFEAQYVKAKELINSGAIGDLIMIRNICRGDLLSDGTHNIDLIRFYADDQPIEWVFGQVDDRQKRTRYGHDVEDSSIAYILFKNGVRAFMETGLVTPATYQQAFIDGTEGRIDINYSSEIPIRVKGKGDAEWQFPELVRENPFKLEIVEMINSIETGKEHILSGRQGRIDFEVLMAVYESSRRRAVVNLPLI